MPACIGCDVSLFNTGKMYCGFCRRALMTIQGRVKGVMRSGNPSLVPASKYKCVDCAKQASAYDHRMYSMPHMVEPVCRRCNRLRGPAMDARQLILAQLLLNPQAYR